MSPSSKSYLCATILAVAAGSAFAYFWQAMAGSIALGVFFWIGLIVFSRIFGVPNRPSSQT